MVRMDPVLLKLINDAFWIGIVFLFMIVTFIAIDDRDRD